MDLGEQADDAAQVIVIAGSWIDEESLGKWQATVKELAISAMCNYQHAKNKAKSRGIGNLPYQVRIQKDQKKLLKIAASTDLESLLLCTQASQEEAEVLILL